MRRPAFLIVAAGLCAGLSALTVAQQGVRTDGEPLAGPEEPGPYDLGFSKYFVGLGTYDVRLNDAEGVERVGASLAGPAARARARAARDLETTLPALVVDLDPHMGTAQYVRSTRTLLTARAEGAFDPIGVARAYVAANAELFQLTNGVLDSARITRNGRTTHNGVTTIWLQQTIDGVDVVGADLRANVTRDGRLATIGSTMLPAPEGGFAPERAGLSREETIRLAAENIGVALREAPAALDEAPDGAQRQRFAKSAELSEQVETRLVYFPLTAETVRPAHEILIGAAGSADVYRVIVDAADGRILFRENCTLYGGGGVPATYRVYTTESPAPRAPGPETPDGSQAPFVARDLITIASLDPVASPDGWIPDGSNETLGNNVDAHTDLDANNSPDLPRPSGSPLREFDFGLDTGLEPSTYREAAVTQLFYWTNWYHDRLYGMGFTEQFSNFQQDNFGRGGVGGDRVTADAQDGSGVNNANFSTTGSDGSGGRCQMYTWSDPNPDRDGDLDAHIVVHELTHGLSIRLHGGLSGIQSTGQGEGWGDFFALSLMAEPGDDPAGVYAMSGYATFAGGSVTGWDENYYFGIRRFPYSTDLTKSPLTYEDIDSAQFGFDASIPRNPSFGPATVATSHNVGEIWCASLWECRANLFGIHGFAANDLMMRLVTDGMKLAPGNPTFLQSRDAIILADMIGNAGANRCALWRGFAKRGMGMSASGPASNSTSGVNESFDVPGDLPFGYPEGSAPATASIGPLTLSVLVGDSCAAPLVPGTMTLHVSLNGGPFEPYPMTEVASVYTGTGPTVVCNDDVRYYISADTEGGPVSDPPGAPAEFYSLAVFTAESVAFDDDLEESIGWTVGGPSDGASAGIWVRVDPVATAAQPEDDHTPGTGTLCFITGNGTPGGAVGANDVDGGQTTVTSPALDCTGGEAFLSYWRWYSNDQGAAPNADSMPIEISNDDGASWILLESVSENANAWVFKSWRVQDFFPAPSSQVRVRFIARDLGSGSIVEAGVDDVSVTTLACDFTPSAADLNGDGRVNSEDLALLLGSWGQCPAKPSTCPADLDGDGNVGSGDMALMLGSWAS